MGCQVRGVWLHIKEAIGVEGGRVNTIAAEARLADVAGAESSLIGAVNLDGLTTCPDTGVLSDYDLGILCGDYNLLSCYHRTVLQLQVNFGGNWGNDRVSDRDNSRVGSLVDSWKDNRDNSRGNGRVGIRNDCRVTSRWFNRLIATRSHIWGSTRSTCHVDH